MTTITVIGKADCHLCDVASEIVDQVVGRLPDDVADQIDVVEESILEDASLYEQWWEKVPVVLIDGKLHGHWRVSPDRLEAAVREAVTGEAA